MTDGRVTRRTLPTMSFTAPEPLLDWLAEEAERRNMKRSHLLTEIIKEAKNASVTISDVQPAEKEPVAA